VQYEHPQSAAYFRQGRLPEETEMLFAIVWTNRAGATKDTDRRSLKLFTNWQPPAGLEFKGFYDYVDGNDGIVIAESNSAEALLEATAP
jgi:hypothetical protein